MDYIIDTLLKLQRKAYRNNEIAVAAIVVKDNKIISRAYNKRMRRKDVTSHAEIDAIRKAEKKIGDWRLNGYDLYVTLEPCSMCKEIISACRLDNCYYFLKSHQKDGKNCNVCYKQTKYNDLFEKILQNSLKKLR